MAEVKNTALDFDSCIGKVDKTQVNTLSDLLGIQDSFCPETEDQAWELLEQNVFKASDRDIKSGTVEADYVARIIFNFSTKEHYDEFVGLLELEVDKKTKEVFFPQVKESVHGLF